ncbi:Os05g0119500 [Oryza sativa Japonica Group]|uniref:Os05g0119500 protein n=1 Tax=Oryza sativa subsp. japonica TaxID=39947 RepID=Q0DL75_ORYSJ|nr:Os05g0119500 [Oryza sativa Japonica Group]|eukprot:NP_001054484.1 Os05g0119500 [Oryza sativa Japonica Group]
MVSKEQLILGTANAGNVKIEEGYKHEK